MCLQFDGFVDVGRDRACPRVLSLVYPSRTRGLLSDRKTDNAHSRGSPFSRRSGACGCGALWFDDATAPSLSSCSTAARFREQERRLLFGAAPYHGESARPRDIRAGGIAWRAALLRRFASLVDRVSSRPSRLARPKICPHDLSPRQHPRRGRAEVARRLRGRRIRSPREVERFLDREPAADLRGAGDLVG